MAVNSQSVCRRHSLTVWSLELSVSLLFVHCQTVCTGTVAC